MRARKPAKAKPEERTAAERLPSARFVAAALLLQRRARAWLRCRKKLQRRQRSRAAKLIQLAVRTWLLLKVATKPYIATAAASSGTEGAPDGEEFVELPAPEPPRSALIEPATTECTICLDGDAEYAVIPCGHRCLCASCIKAVSECPVCRGTMTDVLRVFV